MFSVNTPISLDTYLSTDFKSNIDQKLQQEQHSRTFFAQMMDVWANFDSLLKASSMNDKKIDYYVNALHDTCIIIYSDPKTSYGEDWELRVAEWELYDYLFWNNTFGNNSSTIRTWWDQWCYNINYDLM